MRQSTARVLVVGLCSATAVLVAIGGAGASIDHRPVKAPAASRRRPQRGRGDHGDVVAVFSGARSETTATFSIPPGETWSVAWRFDCAGVTKPAFGAAATQGGAPVPGTGISRSRRRAASGTVVIDASGTYALRVVANCGWRLEVRDEVADPCTTTDMATELRSRSGSITAAVVDLASGKTFLYRPGVAEQTASIVKVDILATLLHEERRSWPLDDDDAALAAGMIEASDNDDATALWDEVGGSGPIATFDSLLGMTDTRPNPDGFWGETTTTALDQVILLRHLVLANALLDATARAYELGLMEHVIDWERWGVSSGPPSSATVALKNGWLPLAGDDWQINSIGYVDGDGRRYLIAVLTTGNPTEQYGIDTIEGISRVVWSELGPIHG